MTPIQTSQRALDKRMARLNEAEARYKLTRKRGHFEAYQNQLASARKAMRRLDRAELKRLRTAAKEAS